jgi:hypothetical protein
MLNCSPFPVETWCTRGWDIAASFAEPVGYPAEDSSGSSTRPPSVLAAIPGKCSEI